MQVDILKDCLVGSHVYAAGQTDVELPEALTERHMKAGSVIPSEVRLALQSRPVEHATLDVEHETATAEPGKRRKAV